MRLTWIKARGVVVSAAIIALQGVPALAQFVPYGGSPDQGNQGYNQYQAHTAQPQYAQPQYTQPQYTAMAYQGSGTRTDMSAMSQPVEAIGPGQMQSAPMQSYAAAPAAGCNCQSPAPSAMTYSQPAPAAMGYESYSSGAGCASGSCGAYNTFESGGSPAASYLGAGSCGGGGGYLGSGYGNRGRRWFGGFYGLFMERDGNPWKALAFSTSTANAPPYYPTDTEFVVNLQDVDQDTFAGAEVRLGSTLGGGGCGCGPKYGWDFGYWGLIEEESNVAVTDITGDTNRLYGMIDYRGLEADMGAGYRPVNHYFDYGPPTTDNTAGGDVEIRRLSVRNSFSVQSLELNLLHFSLLGGGVGYGGGSFGAGGVGGGLGGGRILGGRRGGAACGCDTCAGGCGAGGCAIGGCGCAAPRFSSTCLLGVRYFRIDDDFMYRSDFENTGTAATGFIVNDIDVDNHLVGAQFGCNSTYRCGSSGRWALHCNSVVGIYGNRMEVWNRFESPTSDIRFANGTNADFNLRYEDDDVAVIGELRAGASYQYSCNWRLFGGYRLVGISGVALSYEQIPDAFSTPNQVSYVDSDGSVFLHGLQGGVEFTY